MTVGEKIRATRLQREWTQKKLSDECGIAEPTIRRYELGKLKPKFETVKKIADALGVDPFVLITSDSYPEERYKKSLEYADPIYKYLYSLGYTVARELEDFPLGHLTGKKGTGNIILEAKDGSVATFTTGEFKELQTGMKDVVDTRFYKKLMSEK